MKEGLLGKKKMSSLINSQSKRKEKKDKNQVKSNKIPQTLAPLGKLLLMNTASINFFSVFLKKIASVRKHDKSILILLCFFLVLVIKVKLAKLN